MKLAEFKKLIKEAIEEETKETTMEMMEPYNEIGEIILVMKPKRNMTIDEMIKKVSIYDNINMNEIMGAYMGNNMSEAKKAAKEALKEYGMAKETLQKEMEEYRAAKEAIEAKKKKAKELIEKLR